METESSVEFDWRVGVQVEFRGVRELQLFFPADWPVATRSRKNGHMSKMQAPASVDDR